MLIKQIKPFDRYFKEFFEGVHEFNRVMGNDENDKSLIPLYTELLREEAAEMTEAKTAEDELDSLIDQFTVAGFLAKLCGYRLGHLVMVFRDDGSYKDASNRVALYARRNKHSQAISHVEDLMHIFLTLDIDHVGALREVNNSNMSKFIKVEESLTWEQEEYYDLICKSIVDKGRYTGVTWQRVGNYIVFRDDNGKLMKPPSFREPNLSQYINK